MSYQIKNKYQTIKQTKVAAKECVQAVAVCLPVGRVIANFFGRAYDLKE
ncbi:MAG: hypothetical protein ACOYOS_19780 [Syntrophales bacterium]